LIARLNFALRLKVFVNTDEATALSLSSVEELERDEKRGKDRDRCKGDGRAAVDTGCLGLGFAAGILLHGMVLFAHHDHDGRNALTKAEAAMANSRATRTP
jgi:hypothetical protein